MAGADGPAPLLPGGGRVEAGIIGFLSGTQTAIFWTKVRFAGGPMLLSHRRVAETVACLNLLAAQELADVHRLLARRLHAL